MSSHFVLSIEGKDLREQEHAKHQRHCLSNPLGYRNRMLDIRGERE